MIQAIGKLWKSDLGTFTHFYAVKFFSLGAESEGGLLLLLAANIQITRYKTG
jgi:hypothetical protein